VSFAAEVEAILKLLP